MMWYDRAGNSITVEQYRALQSFDAPEKREAAIRVAETFVGDQRISTVWLGLDHAFIGGPPMIFETLVFPDCDICQRYSTETQALAGHDQIVAQVRADRRTSP